MPKTTLLTIEGKKSGEVSLPGKIFGVKVNQPLMAQAVRVYLANQRKAKAKTKSRGEVEGSGRKIWRQKGTGRARHGDRYAPIFVGGGVTHGPKGNQNFKLKMSKKMKRAALFSALTSGLKEKKIVVVEGLALVKPKTKNMAKVLDNLQLENLKVLIILPEKIETVLRAGRNLKNVGLVEANLLNTYQVLKPEKIVLMKEAIKKMEAQWS